MRRRRQVGGVLAAAIAVAAAQGRLEALDGVDWGADMAGGLAVLALGLFMLVRAGIVAGCGTATGPS
jgi:hypothetical protein